MPRGGRRPGAGRPKGSKEKHTLERELARKQLQDRLLAQLAPITEVYIARARGVFALMVPTELGLQRVHDEAAGVKLMTDPANRRGHDYFLVEFTAPDSKVLLDLIARIDGKPTERVEVSGPAGEPVQIHHHYAPLPGVKPAKPAKAAHVAR